MFCRNQVTDVLCRNQVDVSFRNHAVDSLFRSQVVEVFLRNPETVGGLLFQIFFTNQFPGGTNQVPANQVDTRRLAVWVQETGQLGALKTGCFQVPGKAVWYQERLGCFMRDWVVVSWFHVCFQGVVPGRRWAVSGKTGRFQERLGGFRLGGGFRRRRVVSGRAVWFTAKLCGFTKVCVP